MKDLDYPNKLFNIGIELLEPYTHSKNYHTMRCVLCSHEWRAAPFSKNQANKKHGGNGCPKCNEVRNQIRLDEIKRNNLQKIDNMGFDVLEPYITYKSKMLVRNRICKHEWRTTPEHLIGSSVTCQICNNEVKRNKFLVMNQKNRDEFAKYASDWRIYRSKVTAVTEKNYKDHMHVINPFNYPRGKAGVDGAYQLDHIVSIKYCYNNNIPVESCADIRNLQMLSWVENLSHKDKLKDFIPEHLREFVQ